MMDRQKGTIVFECDACSETLDVQTDNVEAANVERRRSGWAARYTADEWIHLCPGCK